MSKKETPPSEYLVTITIPVIAKTEAHARELIQPYIDDMKVAGATVPRVTWVKWFIN